MSLLIVPWIALGWAAGAALAAWIPLRLAYAFGRVGRGRRRARRALIDLKVRVRGAAAREEEREEAWLDAARAFAADEADRRLGAMPLEELRGDGLERVRWSALAEAGWGVVGEVAQASPQALAAAPGVGEATAKRAAEAASRRADRERSRAPDPPRPDAEDHAPLLRAALRRVAEERELDPRYADVAAEVGPLFEAIQPLAKRSRFWSWLIQPGRRADTAEGLESWCADADRAGETLGDLIAAEGQVQARAGELLGPIDLARESRGDWPDIEQALEEAWVELGLTPAARAPSSHGGLPEAIAQRVEAHPLVTRGLEVTLRRYQAFGARYLLAQERTVLGDEMGLGKTIQALAALTHLWNLAEDAGDPAPAFLIVAPAGLLWNWAREIEARAPFEARVLHGASAEGELAAWAEHGGAAVTSYATMRGLDVATPLATLGPRFQALVCDEAHYAKNPEAQRTQAVARVAARARFVALLSGTPMENRPEELAHVITLANEVAGRRVQDRLSSVERFSAEIAGVYLRRNQADVLTELPERIETCEWVTPGEAELARYRDALRGRNFAELRRAATLAYDGAATAKLQRLDEILDEHREAGRKVLVFTYFLEVLETLAQRLDVVGTIAGGVSPEDRMRLVDDFSAVDGHAVLLLQITAGGTGLNLQAASAVVLVEPQLKPTTEDQAIARAHRMGQTERVLVHRLIARESVDEHLLGLVGDKRALFDAYARESALKDATPEAVERSEGDDTAPAEEKLAARILDAERARLGIE